MADTLALFRTHAPELMRKLMADFSLTAIEAAAIMGNAGHESGGFRLMQELKPTVKGSRGGWGLFQWTGPRRVAMEAYCARNHLNPASFEANYAWLFVELTGSEKKAIPAVKRGGSLMDKVKAFELAFERAGVKHYESRLKYAQIALDAFMGKSPAGPLPPPAEQPKKPLPPPRPKPQPEKASGLLALILVIIKAIARIFGKGKK
jgi:hypothetical protein